MRNSHFAFNQKPKRWVVCECLQIQKVTKIHLHYTYLLLKWSLLLLTSSCFFAYISTSPFLPVKSPFVYFKSYEITICLPFKSSFLQTEITILRALAPWIFLWSLDNSSSSSTGVPPLPGGSTRSERSELGPEGPVEAVSCRRVRERKRMGYHIFWLCQYIAIENSHRKYRNSGFSHWIMVI